MWVGLVLPIKRPEEPTWGFLQEEATLLWAAVSPPPRVSCCPPWRPALYISHRALCLNISNRTIWASSSNLGSEAGDLSPGGWSESPGTTLATNYLLDLGGLWQVSLCWHLTSEKISSSSDSVFRDSSWCVIDLILSSINKRKRSHSCWWSRTGRVLSWVPISQHTSVAFASCPGNPDKSICLRTQCKA